MKKSNVLSRSRNLARRIGTSFLLLVLSTGCAVTASPTPMSSPWVAAFRNHLEGLASEDQFSGTALVAWEGKISLEKAYGLADQDRGIVNETDTLFNLGSMNKMFTAVAIMQLVEDGMLSVGDHIVDVYPEYPNREVAKVVTIAQLLTHTSGMGDCFTGEFFTTPDDQLRTLAGYLPLFASEPLQFEPGSQYGYSNEGYIVLGLIIEKVTGQDYDEVVRQNIFQPVGMADTDSYSMDEPTERMAIGYTTQDAEGNETGTRVENTDLMPIKGTSAGGGYSTLLDLYHFSQSLLANELLEAETTEDLLKGKVEIRENVLSAYGFMDKVIAGQRVLGQGGNAPGVCNLMEIYPDLETVLIILSNTDSGCLRVREYMLANPIQGED